MKDCRASRILKYMERMKAGRRKEAKSSGYIASVLYAREVNSILHMLWLCGSIDYDELKRMEKKYSLTSKDIRKILYCADLISEELEGKVISIESC